jgi:hypothetical protein
MVVIGEKMMVSTAGDEVVIHTGFGLVVSNLPMSTPSIHLNQSKSPMPKQLAFVAVRLACGHKEPQFCVPEPNPNHEAMQHLSYNYKSLVVVLALVSGIVDYSCSINF